MRRDARGKASRTPASYVSRRPSRGRMSRLGLCYPSTESDDRFLPGFLQTMFWKSDKSKRIQHAKGGSAATDMRENDAAIFLPYAALRHHFHKWLNKSSHFHAKEKTKKIYLELTPIADVLAAT